MKGDGSIRLSSTYYRHLGRVNESVDKILKADGGSGGVVNARRNVLILSLVQQWSPEREVRRSHRGRAAAQGAEGGAAVPVYELQDGARNEIAMVCRALDV